MADNVTAPATGLVFATDDLAGVNWPYAKLAFGPDGAAVPVADANGARLPVQIGGTLPAFAATPTVNIGTAPTINVAGPLTDVQLRAAALPVLIGGTLPAFAAVPTVNLGSLNGAATSAAQATAISSLASIDGKLAALDGGRASVATQRTATTTRAYGYAAGQRLTTAGAGQVRSAAVAATEVLLHASVRGFFRVGDGTVVAGVAAGSIPLAADEKFHLQITSGQFVSFVRDAAADGSLTIMPVA